MGQLYLREDLTFEAAKMQIVEGKDGKTRFVRPKKSGNNICTGPSQF